MIGEAKVKNGQDKEGQAQENPLLVERKVSAGPEAADDVMEIQKCSNRSDALDVKSRNPHSEIRKGLSRFLFLLQELVVDGVDEGLPACLDDVF